MEAEGAPEIEKIDKKARKGGPGKIVEKPAASPKPMSPKGKPGSPKGKMASPPPKAKSPVPGKKKGK